MLVVDTSVAIKWMVPEDGIALEADTGTALSLLDRGLIAPDLIMAEFGNALWKKVRKGEIGVEQAREATEILPTILSLVPLPAYASRALEIAFLLGYPVYDCAFIAAAEAHVTPLVTADRRLLRRTRDSLFAPLVLDLASEDWR